MIGSAITILCVWVAADTAQWLLYVVFWRWFGAEWPLIVFFALLGPIALFLVVMMLLVFGVLRQLPIHATGCAGARDWHRSFTGHCRECHCYFCRQVT